MTKKNLKIFAVTAATLAIITLLSVPYIQRMKEQAFDNSARYYLSTVEVYMESYKKEFGRYPLSQAELRSFGEAQSELFRLYFDKEKIPENAIGQFTEEQYPYLQAESFRIVLEARKPEEHSTFWLLEPGKKPMQLFTEK